MSEEVRRVVEQVVAEVQPLRIILFGSRAKGTARTDSDIDLLVVMPDGTPALPTMQRLYRSINHADAAVDYLVASPDVLKRHADNIGLVYKEILRTGQEVYVSR
ncbi:MAG: nucleotidyltransferase domain-containing protein [Bacteroidetes bacterium]|nr:nucleotidyltransferase domain-containing protein [Bacteroidota bacterium]MCH8032121.1 nucleotidyltransferase domain-containing protein [Bacteroidota bacterium]